METYAPVYLQPVVKETFWGGERLYKEYGKRGAGRRIAESWELSAHPAGMCRIAGGDYDGWSLAAYLKDGGREKMLGTNAPEDGELPLMVKLIDAREDLSIQVHPTAEIARARGLKRGKNEMWIILAAEPGAYVYAGVKRDVKRGELAERIADGTLPEILRRIPVQAGDAVSIPAGTIHAIGAGVLLCEVQEACDVTYRLCDYGRRDEHGKARSLHIEEGLAAAKLTPNRAEISAAGDPGYFSGDAQALGEDIGFLVRRVRLHGERAVSIDTHGETFLHIELVGGEGVLQSRAGAYPLRQGDSVFCPAAAGEMVLAGEGEAVMCAMPANGTER